jgi:hypothetical protein
MESFISVSAEAAVSVRHVLSRWVRTLSSSVRQEGYTFCVAAQTDEGARAVLADWLAEHGFPERDGRVFQNFLNHLRGRIRILWPDWGFPGGTALGLLCVAFRPPPVLRDNNRVGSFL